MSVIARNEITLVGVSDGTNGTNGKDGQMLYATCSTAATTAAKVATISSGTLTLATGSTVSVKFTYANTASSPTLNINSTGAKPIYTNGVRYAYWEVGATVTFTYDGTNWNVCSAAVYGNTATIGNPAGYNVYIDGDSVNVKNGSNVLSTFSANEVDIGKSQTSSIYLANRNLVISSTDGGLANIGANNIAMYCTGSSTYSIGLGAGEMENTNWSEAYFSSSSASLTSFDSNGNSHSFVVSGANGIKIDGNTIDDYVVAEGTSGFWRYRKWASGIAECWGANQITVSVTNKWNALYYGSFGRVSYPFTFDGAPNEYITVNHSDGNLWAALGNNTSEQTHNGYLLTVANDTYQIWLEYYAIGKYIVQ